LDRTAGRDGRSYDNSRRPARACPRHPRAGDACPDGRRGRQLHRHGDARPDDRATGRAADRLSNAGRARPGDVHLGRGAGQHPARQLVAAARPPPGDRPGLPGRFAATDFSAGERRGRAIGTLTWVSTLGAAIGPTLAGISDRLAPGGQLPAFTTPFLLVATGLAASGLFVLIALPDMVHPGAARRARGSLLALLRGGDTRRAVVGLVTTHAVMVALMNMATLHMHHGGAPLPIIGVVLSMHTMAMFVPGTLVGYLADRYGAARVLVAGLLLQLLAAAVLYVAGPHDTGLVSLGLVLLGAGWSAGFIAGSALLVAATEEPQRLQAQGAADFPAPAHGGMRGTRRRHRRRQTGVPRPGRAGRVRAARGAVRHVQWGGIRRGTRHTGPARDPLASPERRAKAVKIAGWVGRRQPDESVH